MSVGAAGAINVVLKSLLDPGDEVIILVPFFPEYQFYIENHAGRMVLVDTDDTFQPTSGASPPPSPRAPRPIILNRPNNPTGAVYSTEFLLDLEALVSGLDHPVTVIADEPYKSLIFDGLTLPVIPSLIRRSRACLFMVQSSGDSWGADRLSGPLALPAGTGGAARRLHLRQPGSWFHPNAPAMSAMDGSWLRCPISRLIRAPTRKNGICSGRLDPDRLRGDKTPRTFLHVP